MACLTVYPDTSPQLPNKVLTHHEDIAVTLADLGVQLEQWPGDWAVARDTPDEQIISAYGSRLDEVIASGGYRHVQVGRADRNCPQSPETRARFLGEHCLDQPHVQVFVAGRGLIYLHINGYVYGLSCEKNDVVHVPAGVNHWYDMGEEAHFVCIRLGHEKEGAGMSYSGDEIASVFTALGE